MKMKINLTNEQKPIVKKYLIGYSWLSIFDKPDASPELRKKIEVANKKMEQLEEQLKLLGITEEILGELLKKSKKFVSMSVGEMNDKQRLLMCQLIFGKGTKFVF